LDISADETLQKPLLEVSIVTKLPERSELYSAFYSRCHR